MNIVDVNYPIGHVLKDMTCKVTLSGVRARLVRLAIAKWIIWFGARVAGMDCKVEIQ